MQDEKRRSKFNLIQRLEHGMERLSENIIARANTIDDRRLARAARRTERKAERQARREKKAEMKAEKQKVELY